MANDLLTYPETESRTVSVSEGGSGLDVAFGAALKEKPIWADLYENIRDIFFPPHLPPLELTSKPIPVPDRLKVKANPWAIGIATIFNVTILIIAISFGVAKVIDQVKKNDLVVTPVDVSKFEAPKKDVAAGGGGGSPDKMEAIRGKVPPQAKPLDIAPQTIAAPVPTIDVQRDITIPSNQALPNFGMSNSPNVKLALSETALAWALVMEMETATAMVPAETSAAGFIAWAAGFPRLLPSTIRSLSFQMRRAGPSTRASAWLA